MSENNNLSGYPSVDRPWLKYYAPEHIKTPIPESTLYEYFIENNHQHDNDVAILYQGVSISYGEMNRQIDLCTKALLALGVDRDEVVTVAMPSIPEAVYLVYAINRIGAVANMIHPLSSVDEICGFLNEVKCRVFFMFSGTYTIVRNVLNNTKVEKAVVVSPVQSLSCFVKYLYSIKNRYVRIKEDSVFVSWETFIDNGRDMSLETILPTPKRASRDWAVISHTGGTTGKPKGVICTNKNIIAQIWQITEGRNIKRQDVMMIQLPPFINYSLVSIIESFSYGFKTLLIPHYVPERLVKYIKRYRVSYIHSIPAYWEVLLRIKKIGKTDMVSLKAIASGGESMDIYTEKEVNRLLRYGGSNVDLMKGIGMTESTSGVVGTYPNCNVEGSVGIPFLNTNCKIVNLDSGKEQKYNDIGEICFSGPTIMWGYYNNPEATDEIIHTDTNGTRWLHTGDIGYMTTDGIIYICGRIKRLMMIKDSNGLITKIFPDRIESVVVSHPDVCTCCVVGVPDDKRITIPVAFIELHDSVTATESICNEIQQICSERLADYMRPKKIEIINQLPRTERNKIDYLSLERIASGEK